MTPEHRANHLAQAASPYLKQHAYNPVDWYPWGRRPWSGPAGKISPSF